MNKKQLLILSTWLEIELIRLKAQQTIKITHSTHHRNKSPTSGDFLITQRKNK